MGISLTTAPAVEPVSLADMKLHLRVDGTDDNALITALISVAREYVEIWTGRACISQTWTQTFDGFPDGAGNIELKRPPLLSVTSVVYADVDDADQTWSTGSYTVHTDTLPGHIELDYGESYPSTRDKEASVTVIFVAGYGAAATALPTPIIQAVKLIVGDLYEHREARTEARIEDNLTVQRLLWAYRVAEAV